MTKYAIKHNGKTLYFSTEKALDNFITCIKFNERYSK